MAVGKIDVDGLRDGEIDSVGGGPTITKSVVSVLSKVEAGLITSLSRLSLYHPTKRVPLPNRSLTMKE